MPKHSMPPKKSKLPKGFAQFDELPNSALVSVPTLAAINGVSDSTAWRLVKSGAVKSVLIGSARRVAVGEIRRLHAEQPA